MRRLVALAALGAVVFAGPAVADHGGRDFTDRDVERADGERGSRDEHGSHGGRADDRKAERPSASAHGRESELKKDAPSESARPRSKSGSRGSSGSHGSSGSDDSSGSDGSSGSGDSSGSSGSSGSNDSSGEGSSGDSSGHGSSGADDELDEASPAASAARIITETDVGGHERRSSEVILIGPPQALEAVRAAGYSIISTRPLVALRETLARIRVDAAQTIDQVVQALRALAPEAYIAPNHVFRPARAAEADLDSHAAAVASPPTSSSVSALDWRQAASHGKVPDIGIIDTGADTAWPALATAVIQRRCLAGGDYTSRAHGTAVAEIAAAQGARLAVADVFGVDENNKLIASADAIAAAIDWLLSQRVTLMNISIEGPDNVVLAHVVRSAVAQGAMIVAAAGNGGPAASPVYPAAYPHVIAVTAVDDEDHVYPRANRGDYVAFAARGVRVPVSYGPKGPSAVSGTSFAAPAVAAELAARLADAERADPEAVLAGLQRDAVDLGAPGRDPIFGWGRITSRHRTSIASLQENRLPAIADGAGDNGR